MAVDNAAMFPFEISADISAVPFDPVILNFQPMGSRGRVNSTSAEPVDVACL